MTVTADQAALPHRQSRLPEVPEPGRVVEVRGATWAVADVKRQGLPRSPADEAMPGAQHVVTLQSLEEDRLGEELTVVWELELGHTVVPDQGLPETLTADTFDDPNTLGAFVDAVRWGAVTSADEQAFQAPFRSGANVEPYQLEPLRRALSSPRTNLLLADDVGLGKTIEAGLVIQELLLRHRARTVVIVCPPSLALKWRDEMREKFGLEFVIVNSELLAQVRRTHGLAANPFRIFPRVIISMAWLPTVRPQRLLRDVLDEAGRRNSARRYAFDVLVVDEAHHVAPASPSAIGGGRGYAVDSQRTMATRALAERCEHRLFLSATPHNGHSESFTALMEMIDNRRFSRGATIDSAALTAVTVRRLKSDIVDKGFLPREIKVLPFVPDPDAEDAFATLDDILLRSAQANGRKRSGDILSLLLKKRFLSSPWAFASTLELYDRSPVRSSALTLDDYYTEVLGSEQSDEEEGSVEHPEFETLAGTKATDPLSAASTAQVDRLIAWGRGYEHKPDARLSALIDFLDAVCRPAGRSLWSNERVVIFTEYAATLDWVTGVLRQRGYGPDRLATIQGSTPVEEREDIRARFTAAPAQEPLRVLVATDAAGEGIDLQDHCYRIVNLDVPFNPSRLEQRIGRIDRYGQRHTPEIYYLAPVESSTTYAADVSFMRRIAEKVSTVRTDLGSVNPVIDSEIQQHFGGRATPVRTPRADRGAETINKAMAGEQALNRSLTELSATYAERKHAMHLTAFSARRVVDTALALSDQPPLILVGDQDTDAEVFEVGHLGPRWQPALRGLATRLCPDTPRPITFDDQAAVGRSDLVHVHLGHALLQKSARLLRSSLFGSDSRVHRVTAVIDDSLPMSCVAAVSRLVLVGRGGLRLHEEVFVSGIRLRGSDMAEDKVNDLLDRVLDAPDLSLAPEQVRDALARQWGSESSRMRTRLEEAMRRRAERRQFEVTTRLEERRDSDIERARGIYTAFCTNLQDSLALLRSEAEEQLAMLFSDDQQRQRQRDIRAMEDRLSTLSAEEEREVDGIRERYADVQPFVAAAAVVFALTPADATSMGAGR
jgi:superfamily II DNA or RNA helicase